MVTSCLRKAKIESEMDSWMKLRMKGGSDNRVSERLLRTVLVKTNSHEDKNRKLKNKKTAKSHLIYIRQLLYKHI